MYLSARRLDCLMYVCVCGCLCVCGCVCAFGSTSVGQSFPKSKRNSRLPWLIFHMATCCAGDLTLRCSTPSPNCSKRQSAKAATFSVAKHCKDMNYTN